METDTTTQPTTVEQSNDEDRLVPIPLSHALRYQRLMELGAERLLRELEATAFLSQPTRSHNSRQPLGFTSAKAWTPPTSEYTS